MGENGYNYDMDTINEAKRRQNEYISSLKKISPELFRSPTLVEDAYFLRNLGIYIPGKEKFVRGMIKRLPSDFIVEEIGIDGKVCTIELNERDASQITGPFIHATLVKCNMSTIEAVDEIVAILKCQKTDIGYGGIKDKEAITAQRISFKNIPIDKIKSIRSSHFFIKDIATATKPMQKGVIGGNRFTIYVRTGQDIFTPEHTAEFARNLERVKDDGFYNFYYLQRFGMPRLINVACGIDIIQGQYERAIRRILTETSPLENQFSQQIRKKLTETWGDWNASSEIVKDVPLLFREETAIIRFLQRKPGHWQGALQQLMDKVSLMVYSVPSLLFNEYISMELGSGNKPPPQLPLIFSTDQSDIDLYKPFLEALKLYPLPTQYVRQFSIIRFMKRSVPTKDIPDIHSSTATNNGIIVSFSLAKGQYATTFLSHLFNLVSGTPPPFISEEELDVKSALGEGSCAATMAHFEPVIRD